MAAQLDIVSQIKSYWKKKATGALFLKLTDGRLLQLFFVNGELRSLKYQGATGMDALKLIPGLVATAHQFHEGAISRIINELPPTVDIIKMVSGGAVSGGGQEISPISTKVKDIVERIFTEYVGPIADLIFAEEADNAESVHDLIRRLSVQIDDVTEQMRFREEVEAEVKNL